MRHPVVIQSLEEDFRELGIIDQEAPDEGEDFEEARRIAKRRSAGGKTAKRTKRTSAKKLRAGKRYRRAHKGKISRTAKVMGKKASVKRRKKWLALHHADVPDLASILEDVQAIVSQLDENTLLSEDDFDLDTTIRSFANIAIISEMLSDFFGNLVEDEELSEAMGDDMMEDIADANEFFVELAEASADIATTLSEELDEDEEIAVEELQKIFQEHMDDLVDGLEFYADLTEDEDEDEDDLDEDDGDLGNVEEMAKKMAMSKKMKKMKGDDDDDDDDGKEMPAFLKKKMGMTKDKMAKKMAKKMKH